MKPGPPPKPSALKRLAGQPGHHVLPKEPEIKPPEKAPRAPRWLSGPAREEWRRLTPLLVHAGLYTDLDFQTLALYCQAVGDWREALEKINQTGGKVLTGTNGGLYQNPWVSLASKAREQALRLIQEFGLSPAAVGRVQFAETEPPKPGQHIPAGGYLWEDLISSYKEKENDESS